MLFISCYFHQVVKDKMYLDKCNDKLLDMHVNLINYITEMQNNMLQLVKEEALRVCKYPIGTEFNSLKYGKCIIVDLVVNLNRNENIDLECGLIIFDEMYKPYYTYKVKSETISKQLDMNLILVELDINKIFEEGLVNDN